MFDPERTAEIAKKLNLEENDPILAFFRSHERSYEKFGDELRAEGYEITSIEDAMMLIQIEGKLPLTREPFFFHAKRSTLGLSIGKVGSKINFSDDESIVWNKQKFLDKDGKAQDTFDLGDEDEDGDFEPDADVTDLMPNDVIEIFRQLVTDYRESISIEGEFKVVGD